MERLRTAWQGGLGGAIPQEDHLERIEGKVMSLEFVAVQPRD